MKNSSLPFLLLLVAGCAGTSGTTSMGKTKGTTPSMIINSEIINASGQSLGEVRVSQEPEGTRVLANLVGLPVGTFAVHLHAVGKCEAPGFTTAAGHFNPGMREHGKLNPAGAHAGDLPNITVGDDRRGTIDFVQPGLRMADGDAPLIDLDGAAIVIHAGPDDYKTDPTGNAGARIACGVLARPRQAINPG